MLHVLGKHLGLWTWMSLDWVEVINNVISDQKTVIVRSLLRIYSPLVSGRFEELIQHHQGQRSQQGCLSNRPTAINISNNKTVQVSQANWSVLPLAACHLCDTMTSDQQERKDCSCVDIVCILCIGHTAHVQSVSGKLWKQDICIWLRTEQEIKSTSGGGAGYCVWAVACNNNDLFLLVFLMTVFLHNRLPQKENSVIIYSPSH